MGLVQGSGPVQKDKGGKPGRWSRMGWVPLPQPGPAAAHHSWGGGRPLPPSRSPVSDSGEALTALLPSLCLLLLHPGSLLKQGP